jgi:hypothetical protein
MDYPAPWKLNGEGIILTYSFNKNWILENGFVPAHLHYKFKGGLSFVMIADYKESDCGPYQELVFIPGLFNIEGKYQLMITKTYVNSEESKVAGRSNWGIPKELAELNWKKDGSTVLFNAKINDNKFFETQIQSNSIAFPVNNTLIPFKFYQELEENSFLFQPKGRGRATSAKVKGTRSVQTKFPDLSNGKYINCLHIKNFNLSLPKSEIKGI